VSARFGCIFLVLILVFSAKAISGPISIGSVRQIQNQSDPEKLDISAIVPLIEQRHGATIFYKAEWFSGQKYERELVSLPLPQALSGLVRGLDLNILTLEGMIFLIPAEGPATTGQVSMDDLMVIGNPNEFGRYSRATVSGIITDGTTGEPLFGAVIYEPVSGQGTTTNFDGRFSIHLPVGDYRLRITYIGYQELYQRVRLISDGEIELSLFSGSTQLQEFVVTALRAEENVSRTQMSMISLDSRAIRELPGSFGERDIVRSITLLPGIQTVGEFGTGFNVRGGSADQNLILMEHVPLFNSSHLFGLISVVNPDLVSNVTLIKAGTPAKYGERASSVMDIRLGNGLNQEHFTLKGGIGILNSRILLETPIVKDVASVAIGARSSNSDWYLRRMPSEDLMNSSAGFWDVTGLINLAITPNNRLTLFGYHSFDRFGFSEDTDYNYSNTLASIRWNSRLGHSLSSTMIAGISDYDFHIQEQPELDPASHYSMNSAVSYESLRWILAWTPGLAHNVEFGVNAIRYGVEPGEMYPLGRHSTIQQRTIAREQAVELAGFISNDFAVTENISMEAGLRYSHYRQLGETMVYIYDEDQPMTPENIRDSIFYGANEVVAKYGGLEPRFGTEASDRGDQLGQSSALPGYTSTSTWFPTPPSWDPPMCGS
jgi:hypothetical protein